MLSKKYLLTFLFCLAMINSFSQQGNIHAYVQAQYNHTLNDYTKGNNPWAVGLGIEAFLNNKKWIKPAMEITGDIYLENDKVLRSNPDGTFPSNGNDLRAMVCLFGGFALHPIKNFNLLFLGGASLINEEVHFGIKPSLQLYLSKNEKWTGKFSYINIFNRINKVDFGSLSIAIGFKIL